MAQEYLPAPSNVRLADLMKEHNISQPELAKEIGCSKSTISRFISGAKGTLTHEQVLKIARLFNVSTDFLLGETNIPDRKNYDIAELGLSVEAAKNLYTGRVNAEVVNLLLEAIPDLQLRLDANRAWTPLKAQQFAKYVNPAYRQRIAFLEEPCKTREDSRAFSRETGIAIAWDESLREADFRFVAEPGVRAVVIKPTLTGSLQKVQQQVAAAHALGLSVVISSSIESSLGLTQLARVAAWLTPQTIPGLDTLALMGAQLVRPWPESALPVLNIDALEPLL